MITPKNVLLLLLSIISFYACTSSHNRNNELPDKSDYNLHQVASGTSTTLGPGDVFEVKVFGEMELSGIYRISVDGMISFPLIGKLKAEGLSSIELTDLLTAKLKQGYLKDPQVSVFVKEYSSKKIFVFGEVQKPGTFMYEEQMTIIQAITVAGGFAKSAAKNKVSVTRLEDGIEKRIFLSVEEIGRGREKNFFLLPGDIVFVPESFF